MRIVSLAIIVASLLAGCATNTTWTKPGATQVAMERDRSQCQYETDRATAAIDNPVHAGVQDALLNQSCMKAKGWTR